MTDKQKEFIAVANRVLLGNQEAINFLLAICGVLHLWDDLIDRDKPLSNDEISAGFFSALITLPRNSFYAANFSLLNPILEMAIYNWQAANQMEADGDEYSLRIAYILRSSYSDLATMCARIVGGPAHAGRAAVEIHQHWHSEGWDAYQENLAAEKMKRDQNVML